MEYAPITHRRRIITVTLWTRGLLSSSASEWQNEICTGLTVDENFYGVEQDTYIYSGHYDHLGVVIPPFFVSIEEQHLQHLRDNFNPFANSSNNGIDIYLAVKLYLNNL